MTDAPDPEPAAGPRAEARPNSPAALGYRWPAEWEPHRATWLSWPHNLETWPGPGGLEAAEAAFVAMVRALAGRELLRINVTGPAMEDRVVGLLRAGGVDPTTGIELFHFPTNDAWVRDHGPVFLVRDVPAPRSGREPPEAAGRRRCLVDFGFDAWGGKYPPWDLDDAIPGQVASALGLARFEAGFVLEAGSVEGDGRGTVLTTASCLLHPARARGQARTRESMERSLADFLAARQVHWLEGEIEGDDTDGHIDNLVRFVGAATLVAVIQEDRSDPGHGLGAEALRHLRGLRDADGKAFAVAALPLPPPVRVAGVRCPASYANFYLANGVALVPVFQVPSDARALAVLRELLPGRDLVPIPARGLIPGLGAVHCLTQQEPL